MRSDERFFVQEIGCNEYNDCNYTMCAVKNLTDFVGIVTIRNMNHSLAKFVDVIAGYSFRGAIPVAAGGHKVVQVKDIDSAGEVMMDQLVTVASSRLQASAPLLNEGDVLVSVRGSQSSLLKVGIFKGSSSEAIAASSLSILRVKDDRRLIPEYLFYYLRTPHGQRALKSIMRGAAVHSMPKKELESLEIQVPAVERQRLIVEAVGTAVGQKELYLKKAELLQRLADNIIITKS